MIPKTIHYIWFGPGEMKERHKLCLDSWKKYEPDWEIKKWNENNFDVTINKWCRGAYENKKWAFVSDYARLWILYNYGGVYMDADVELYKPIDEFLVTKGFTGFEAVHYPACGLIGAEKGNPVIKKMMDVYENMDFILFPDWKDYITNERTSVCIQSNILAAEGINRDDDSMQYCKDFVVYPSKCFHTKDEGYSYHSWEGSW